MNDQQKMQTKEVIDRIFKEPGIQYELTEQAKSRVEQLIEEAART